MKDLVSVNEQAKYYLVPRNKICKIVNIIHIKTCNV